MLSDRLRTFSENQFGFSDWNSLEKEIGAWCAGKVWQWRAPILAWLAYIGVRHLFDPMYTSLFGGLNLGIHEGGHIAMGWAPEFFMVAGGTLFQLAAPLIAAFLFLRQPDYFAVPFCGAWLSINLYNVATYVGDAREMGLPLVTVGSGEGGVEHDWNYMLSALHLINLDTAIAGLIRVLAFALMWGSILACAWVLRKMAKTRR